MVAQFERRIAELEQQLSQREQQKTKASSRGKDQTSFKLRWREGKRAPYKTSRWYDAVVDGNTVYIKDQPGTQKIYSFNVTGDSWSQLPDCVYRGINSSVTVINGWLTNVGGRFCSTYFNELFSLTGEGSSRRWTKRFPSMPTKRIFATSLCTGTTLIVAGGMGVGGRVLSTVEVMNIETHQWSTAADLPESMRYTSATVCGHQLYMLGGFNKDRTYTKSVYTCSVSALLHSCVLNSLEAKVQRILLVCGDKLLIYQLHNLPVSPFMAVGGRMDSEKPTTAIYMYDLTTNSWEIISHMTTCRWDCFTAVLPDNRLMVVGGMTETFNTTDKVELV